MKIDRILILIGSTLLIGFSSKGQTIFALSGNQLISFNALIPSLISNTVPLSGITSGQLLEGLDFRPATGELFGIGYNQTNGSTQLYRINTASGAAIAVNTTPIALQPNLGKIGFDFNPTVDRIRVTGSNNANYRLNPINGSIAATDLRLSFAVGDPNFGTNPSIGAGAYTNSYIGASSTSLFNYDDSLNIITFQNPPNNGSLNTIGSSGIVVNKTDPSTDIDIFYDVPTAANRAYLVANVGNSSDDNLYTLNTTTGVATSVGAIGLLGTTVTDIAVQISPANLSPVAGQLVYAITASNSLISFDSDAPTVIRSQSLISGLGAGLVVAGADFRPATGQLYVLGYNSINNKGQLYTINISNAAATAIGDSSVLMLGSGPVGVDFNPMVDRIRVVGSNNANYRLHPETGAIVLIDGPISFAAGDVNFGTDPAIGSVAYTNSFKGTTSTSLYDYDDALNILAFQNPPNAGTLTTIGSSGIVQSGTDPTSDLDIYYNFGDSTNKAYLISNQGTVAADNFYKLSTTTGQATLIGKIGNGIAIRDIAILIDSIPVIISVSKLEKSDSFKFRSFPNPSDNGGYLSYELKSRSEVKLSVNDITGKEIQVIETGKKNPGINSTTWKAHLLPGMYFLQLQVDGKTVHTQRHAIK